MKKFFTRSLLAVVACAMVGVAFAATAAKIPCAVYEDDQKEVLWIPSGYMGNTGSIAMDDKCTTDPHTGKVCLKVDYKAKDNWGGVVWQSPANDWGDQPGGFDLTGAKTLSFWAKGDKGGETVSFSFGLLGSDKKFHDTAKGEIKDQVLTKEWKQYTIDLKDKDLTCIKTGFCWVLGAKGDPVTFYLDDIRYE